MWSKYLVASKTVIYTWELGTKLLHCKDFWLVDKW